jgi:protein-L-isoaspartate(D-aspartate) O-methyltransferase
MNYDQARFNMVEQQIRTWDVLDSKVLELFAEAPREAYVPEAYKDLAYADTSLPLHNGHHMLPPREQARILQALKIKPSDKILEVGTGTGYMTAFFAKLGHHVVSLDIDAELSKKAAAHLAEQDIRNVELKVADGSKPWTEDGNFDVICLLGSVEQLSQAYAQQLNVGGRLFAIIGNEPAMEATLITRLGENDWQNKILFETIAPRLVHAQAKPQFEF